jgi:ADP-ribosylglycohydrolase/protein-tyrosine phosphatase
MIKTSLTHPLRIDSVRPPRHAGEIGMTLCPGKTGQSTIDGYWRRDLAMDMEVIRAWGCTRLVTLMESDEIAAFQVADLREKVPPGIRHYHLPIPDGGVPDAAWEQQWAQVGPLLGCDLVLGERIVIHCRGGLGRTGLVAARLLVDRGMDPEEAMAAVRKARPGTIENRAQEDYVRSHAKRTAGPPTRPYHRVSPDRASRFRGCLLGGAVGDALGAPVEFLDLAAIRARFGKSGVRDMAPAYGRQGGAITDDTQMTLFTAEGILGADIRALVPLPYIVRGCVCRSYLRWLLGQPALFSQRAPGNTCVSALSGIEDPDDPKPPRNQSKGCGGVMRVAPVGLYAAGRLTPEQAFTLGRDVSALTHGHPTGQLPGGALAAIICQLAEGKKLRPAIQLAKRILQSRPAHGETLRAITRAEQLAADPRPDPEVLAELGQGWVAEEALAIALCCALRAVNLEEGVIMAANITGDSDSTAAITGNLMGAMLGVHEIPERWLEPLELRGVITEVADHLAMVHDWASDSADGDHEKAGVEMAYYWERYGAH